MDLAHLAELIGTAVASAALTILARPRRPAPPPADVTGSYRAIVPSVAPRLRVLVVDDEPSFLRLIRRMLTTGDLDVDVDTATTPAEALALARAHAYAVVVVDLKLVGGDGLALLPKLRSRSIIHSGAPDDVLDALRRDGAADRVIGKDGRSEDLVAAVRALL